MKITNITGLNFSPSTPKREKTGQQEIPKTKSSCALSCENLSIYNKAFINFKGYNGDTSPSKRLFWILSGKDYVGTSFWANDNLYNNGQTGWKKWVNIAPEDLLKANPKDAIEMICTLNNTHEIPNYIPTPDYGNNWGRRANYIEINPRTIALVDGSKKSEGILNMIKLLPAIPPSPKSFANCIILSQLYPTIGNDGKVGAESLYTADLHSGISKNLTSEQIQRGNEKIKDTELVKAFNDLAHLRGFKTGIRMPLSSGQLRVQGREFNWYTEENSFIDACCNAVDMGFDAIYFDSAKHIGWYDMANYYGNGDLPNFQQMQYITDQIRRRTGRNDIAFIGEKCNDDRRYKEMGLTAGTDWGHADDYESVYHEYKKQRNTFGADEYAAGPDVSNDNDDGSIYLEQRRHRIHNALNAYEDIAFKLPSYMQMHDLFPLSPYTNTHQQMLFSQNKSAYGDTESNYNNIFNTSYEAKSHTKQVYEEFLKIMYA